MNAVPVQAVLQGVGLISGVVSVQLTEPAECAVVSVTLRSLEAFPIPFSSDRFLFNLSSLCAEKKKILLTSAVHLTDSGRRNAVWELTEGVESAFGTFHYSLRRTERDDPLRLGETLIFTLQSADDRFMFRESSFLDAPASTLDGYQAAVVIKFRGGRQALAGGQFEKVGD